MSLTNFFVSSLHKPCQQTAFGKVQLKL